MHKIILVDDDQGICDSFAALLRGEGYSVDATTDSEEAATLIKKERYDICLFDYKMKGFDGIELLKMLKKVNPRCPVFLITGMLDIDMLKTNASLADGIISKPFDVEKLLQRIAATVQ